MLHHLFIHPFSSSDSHRTVAPTADPSLAFRVDNAKKKVDDKAMALLVEKKKQRASAVNLADKRKAV